MENDEKLLVTNLIDVVNTFKHDLSPTGRETSFDYCYNYFRKTEPSKLVEDMEKSCLVLGFYLASWGMFRGSGHLLYKSVKHFEPTIKYIAEIVTHDRSVWDIDVDNYDINFNKITDINRALTLHLAVKGESTPSVILVTKVMLGVFGFIPAYDDYFVKTFGRKLFKGECSFSKVDDKSLSCLQRFYKGQII